MSCCGAASQAAESRLVSTLPIKDVSARLPTPQAQGPRHLCLTTLTLRKELHS
jgi:hypothetical protein